MSDEKRVSGGLILIQARIPFPSLEKGRKMTYYER